MTDKYWVGGAGTWTTGGTTKWSLSDGGASGAAIPTATDNVFITSLSGTPGTITVTGAMACLDLNVQVTGWTVASTGTIAISGNMNLTALVTWTGTGTLTYNATTSKTIKTSATSFGCSMIFNGVAGTWTLQDNLTLGAALTTTLTNGTLALGTFTLSTGLFSSNNSNTRVLNFGTGAITLTAATAVTAWTTATVTNLTVSGTPIVNTTGGGATIKTINTGVLSEANSISFNLQNSAGTVLFTSTNVVKNLTLNGAFTLTNIVITIYGNLTYTASTTLSAGTNAWTFGATSSKTITSSATLDFPLTFNGVAGTWVLGANLTMGSTRTLTHANGTIDLNGKTLTVGTAYTTATGTKNLTFNAGTLICPTAAATAFNNAVPTGYTTTAGTGTGFISMTAATAKSFVGGGSTFNCTLSQDGAGALTITDANTFGNIRNTTQPVTISFTAATTTTFLNGFALSGTAGNLVTINSATAATHTLSKTTGTISGDYLSITNSTATGGALWYAGTHSTDGGGNTGWIFTAPNYGLTALNGTYAVTGKAATLTVNHLLTAANGTYAITGKAATLTVNRVLSATNGTYAVTGKAATLTVNHVLTAASGTYAVTGKTATLTVNRLLTAASGTYAVTGKAATITYATVGAYVLTALNGTYAVTGKTATIAVNHVITALNGTYAVTGKAATVTYAQTGQYTITALSGTYALIGQAATVTYTPSLIIVDTHDGDYHKKKFEEEKARAARKKADIVQAYEQLVEGRPSVAEEIAAPYIQPPSKTFAKPTINYDKLLADTDRAEKLWRAYLEMDDEEVLLLL